MQTNKMKKMSLALGLAAFVASSAVVQAQQISRAVTSHGYAGGKAIGVTSTFKPRDHKIYGVIFFDRIVTANARGVWTAVKAVGVPANTKILEKSTGKMRMDRAHFYVELPRDWPKGSYKLDVYVDGKLKRTLRYTIA